MRSAGLTCFQTTFNTSKYTVNGGEPGAASGFACSVAIIVPTQAVASTFRAIAGRFGVGPNTGYLVASNATISDIRFTVIDGAGSAVTAPMYNIAAGVLGKVLLITGVHTGTGVALYINGVSQGAESPIVGYSVPAVASQIGGRSSDSQAPSGIWISGMATCIGVPSAVDVARHFKKCVSARRVVPLEGAVARATHCWSLLDGAKTATLKDSRGNDDMRLVEVGGNTSVKRFLNPRWA